MAIFTTSERKRKEETIEVLRKEIKRQKACNDLVSHQLEKLQNDYKYCKSVVISYRNTLAVAEDFMEKNKLLKEWIVKRNNEAVEREGK